MLRSARTLFRVLAGGALAVLLALALASAPAAAGTIRALDCTTGPGPTPAYAFDVAEHVRANDGDAPGGYEGGRTFQNREGHLDDDLGPFREYDVHPLVPGQDRGPERIVLGPSDAASYYTPDHYETFHTMYGDACTA